jgi:hypothetical protein
VIRGLLRGHATDWPARWKEPPALAAADHTSQRARQGRGRRIRRRVGQECARRRGATGSLIPHAPAIERRRASLRQVAEQYACPRSHATQIANGRLQSRQILWRRGTSTSEPRRTPTGQRDETVTQQAVTCLGPSEHRGGHRGSGGANSGPSPSSAAPSAYARPPEAVDADTLWTQRTRPQGLQISQRTRDSHSAHRHSLVRSEEEERRTTTTSSVQI